MRTASVSVDRRIYVHDAVVVMSPGGSRNAGGVCPTARGRNGLQKLFKKCPNWPVSVLLPCESQPSQGRDHTTGAHHGHRL
jgi:hypothetical protein